MKSKFTAAILSLFVLGAASPFEAKAQNFYDDDIYDASKPVEKPAKTEKPAKSVSAPAQTIPSLSGTGYYYGGDGNIYPEYKAAGSYSYNSGNTRDVDEYNRRGIFARSTPDSIPADSLSDYFAYTRRLERFHNPDIVDGSTDEELKELYYTENQAPCTTTINLYVQDTWPYYNPYRWGYFGPSWSFSWGFGYRPWVNWGWGWGYYDPYWSWGPAWGPAWAWGPVWGPSWGPSWGWGPYWGWAPRRQTGIGSSMTHRPVYAGSHGTRPRAGVGSRPGVSGYRPGSGTRPSYGSSNTRPGTSVGGHRPGANVRPGANSSNSRPGYQQNRRPGANSTYQGQGTRPGTQRQPSYNNNHNYNRNPGSYSRPSTGGGSRGGYSGGGGSRGGHSGGGGGGRGSRR